MKSVASLRTIRRFVALLAPLGIAGCFKMGLPERIAPTVSPAMHARDSSLALFAPPHDESLAAPSTLGHQFIFGALPFTRMVLPGSAAEYFRETALSELARRFAVVIEAAATRAEQEQIIRCLPSVDTFQYQLTSIDVNGYDAIFFRVLSVAIDYTLGNQPQHLQERRFSLFASAPELEQLLYRNLSRQLRASTPRRSHATARDCEKQILYIRAPHLDSLSPDSITSWNRSFGFRSAPTFTRKSAARMIQKGIAAERQNDSFLLLAVLGERQLPPSFHANAAELETYATFDQEQQTISLRFRIRTLPAGQEIVTSDTFGPTPINPGAGDGEFGRVLQNTARAAFATFLSGHSKTAE